MSNSCCGCLPAGAIGGARAGKPTPCRYFRMAPGSVRAATTFTVPPQPTMSSKWNTSASRTAQDSLWRRCAGVDVPFRRIRCLVLHFGPWHDCALSRKRSRISG